MDFPTQVQNTVKDFLTEMGDVAEVGLGMLLLAVGLGVIALSTQTGRSVLGVLPQGRVLRAARRLV